MNYTHTTQEETVDKERRDAITDQYISNILDGMDMSDLVMLAGDMLMKNLDELDDDEFVEEVNRFYPELLGDTDAD